MSRTRPRPVPFVTPLDEGWRAAIDAVARAHRYPTTGDVDALGAAVAKLSLAYNDPNAHDVVAATRGALPARLGFSFARDVPKSAAAVRELVGVGALAIDHELRLLDIGAGLGATTWGIARALAANGASGVIDATWVDVDTAAMTLGLALVDAKRSEGGVTVHARKITTTKAALPLEVAKPAARYGLIAFGQVLSELDRAMSDDERVKKHAAFVTSLAEDALAEHGTIVIVEPALRDRTRHLHRVRDALLATGALSVFAPCLHAAPCPMLLREEDWCHEDLAIDLPAWLVPVARAAQLRWQGLSFSYLVLRRDATTLARALRARGYLAPLRVVSAPIVSKGKHEIFTCGDVTDAGARTPTRARVMRLDREESEANAGFGDAVRGDLIDVEPSPAIERPRVGRETRVRLLDVVEEKT